ncbi:hypothetical protein CEXT_172731 [Caerostris extrusa]|uniref:Uncharacterized protein n=1 Tax=Caerostris extrusa TaxID=172846 RepID=A0AAV4W6D6_CAEEX|nr:hypothetical protein CEXT_172731 [Caerostris extrusa]
MYTGQPQRETRISPGNSAGKKRYCAGSEGISVWEKKFRQSFCSKVLGKKYSGVGILGECVFFSSGRIDRQSRNNSSWKASH